MASKNIPREILFDPAFWVSSSGILIFAATSPVGFVASIFGTLAIMLTRGLRVADPPFLQTNKILELAKDDRTPFRIIMLSRLAVMLAVLVHNTPGLLAESHSVVDFFLKGMHSTFLPALGSASWASAGYRYAEAISVGLKAKAEGRSPPPVK